MLTSNLILSVTRFDEWDLGQLLVNQQLCSSVLIGTDQPFLQGAPSGIQTRIFSEVTRCPHRDGAVAQSKYSPASVVDHCASESV